MVLGRVGLLGAFGLVVFNLLLDLLVFVHFVFFVSLSIRFLIYQKRKMIVHSKKKKNTFVGLYASLLGSVSVVECFIAWFCECCKGIKMHLTS